MPTAAAQTVDLASQDMEALAQWLAAPETEATVLRRGAWGHHVRGLQAALTLAGESPGRVDGLFGNGTEKAVATFQERHGLRVDGAAGRETRAALAAATAQALALTHRVAPGETLSHIALRYGVTVDLLAGLNQLANPNRIRVGATLMVPPQDPAAQGAFAAALAAAPLTAAAAPAPAGGTGDGTSQPPAPEPEAPQPVAPAEPAEPVESTDPAEPTRPAEPEAPPAPAAPASPGEDHAAAPAPGPYVVALTFNDGPDDQVTPRLLDLLATHNVQATFFITGADGRRHPDIVRRMARQGHLVENHGWSHTPLHLLDPKAGEEEIEATARLIAQLTGRRSTLFRQPGAGLHPQGLAAARSRGHQVLLWTNVGAESLPGVTAQDLVRWLQNPHPGSILMLHATNPEVVQALTILLPQWQAKGIRFVTLAGMGREE